MTDREREIVGLIERNYTRHEIGQQLGLGDTAIKRSIRKLCARYQCSMRELPRKTKEKHDGSQGDF